MKEVWVLEMFEDDTWFFSTKELAEKAIKFFELNDYEYCLTEVNKDNLDDKELLYRINDLTEEERKEKGL